MKVKIQAEVKYKRHTEEISVRDVCKLMLKKAERTSIDSQGVALVDGQEKRFFVLRVYGDWK